MKRGESLDSSEIFDNIKKLHYSFYLWLNKFGLIHYFNGCYYIIDLCHLDFDISNTGEIRYKKLSEQQIILLINKIVDNFLNKEKEIIKLQKQNNILKQLILFFGVTIIMLILSLL